MLKENEIKIGERVYVYGDEGVNTDLEFEVVAIVKRGDKIKFEAESEDGNIILNDLEISDLEIVSKYESL